jgi:diguanylate cyclase (GGDEF)-like protein
MSRPGDRFFSSRLVRRLLALFVACAVLPIAALTIGSLGQVSDQLEQQAQARLQQASKSAGMSLVANLLALRAWADVGGAMARGELPAPEIDGHVRRMFRAMAILPHGAEAARPIFGEVPRVPEAPRDVRTHLARGRSWVTTAPVPGHRPTILLVHPGEPAAEDPGLLVAEIDPEPLFAESLAANLPLGARLWALDHAGRTIYASDGAERALPYTFQDALDTSSSGNLTWDADGEAWVAGYWSAFIKPQFATPQWTVVVAQPRALALEPIAMFRTIFPLTAGLLLAVALLVILLQLRKRMSPLHALGVAASRVARRDFDVRVEVDSGDEFEDLARSFNGMANRLNEQFDALAALIEVDRALLASGDERQIVTTLADGVRRLAERERVAVLMEESDRPGTMWMTVEPNGLSNRAPCLAADQTALLLGLRGGLSVAAGDPAWRCLEPLAAMGMDRLLVLPIIVDHEAMGLIAIDLGDAGSLDPEREVFVRQLADQASVALTNARTVERNRRLAHFDSLTGLPNRDLFAERLEQALLRVRRPGDRVGIGLLDVDGFKRVNDTLGHGAGDELICQVARRLARVLREGTLARMGGDEFTFIVADLPDADVLARAAQRLLDALDEPFEIDGREVFVTASVGLAVSPDDGAEPEALLRNADAAMYYAKSRTGSSFRFYDASMNEAALQRLELEYEMRRAIERDEFRVYYQPIVDTRARRIIGVEALVRWQHPRRGLVGPDDFVPLAEESGLIVPLGDKVLWTACRDLRALADEGLGPLRLSVNLSVRQLADREVVDRVRSVLQSAGWPASQLVLEITESMLMSPDQETAAVLRMLRGLGVALSIDDFGSGYSSLGYLKNFEVDHLKIDRVFVSDLEYDQDDAEITAAILAMAQGLGLGVVAEGVQTEAQLEYLRERHCDWVQGFLFSPPVPLDTLRKLLLDQAPD